MAKWNKRPQNYCSQCGYSWSPRGHYVSAACPRCGAQNVKTTLGCSAVAFLIVGGAVAFVAIETRIESALRDVTRTQVLAVTGIAAAIAAVAIALKRYERDAQLAQRSQQEQQAQERQQQEQQAEAQRQQERRDALVNRFGIEAADKILAQHLWVGATEEMVVEALGPPVDVSERVLKTKTTRVYKYLPLTRGRFGLKVTIENDVVVGWDKGE